MKKQTIGILNKGKNNTFVNNRFSGFDIAAKDEGINSYWKDNKMESKKIKKKWFQTWWGQLILGLVITIIGGFILKKITG